MVVVGGAITVVGVFAVVAATVIAVGSSAGVVVG